MPGLKCVGLALGAKDFHRDTPMRFYLSGHSIPSPRCLVGLKLASSALSRWRRALAQVRTRALTEPSPKPATCKRRYRRADATNIGNPIAEIAVARYRRMGLNILR